MVLSIVWVRGRAGMPASTSRWVEINTAILVTSVLWLRLGRASYVRRREPLFAAFRLNGAGWGGGYAFVRLLLDRAAPAAASSRRLLAAVRRTAMVTAASSVLPMVVWWAIPLRIW